MAMIEELHELETQAARALASSKNPAELAEWKSAYLGKQGAFTRLGKGLGGLLLGRLIEDSAKTGLKQMLAVITAERANSVRVHEKAGFRHVGVYEAVGFKFDRWLDIVHMQKAL